MNGEVKKALSLVVHVVFFPMSYSPSTMYCKLANIDPEVKIENKYRNGTNCTPFIMAWLPLFDLSSPAIN